MTFLIIEISMIFFLFDKFIIFQNKSIFLIELQINLFQLMKLKKILFSIKFKIF